MAKNLTGKEWLRSKMEELGYVSLEEVASDMGINRGNLYRYFSLETKPSIAMLPTFCDVLQVEPNEIMWALEILPYNQSL